jgi:hypothetical protein
MPPVQHPPELPGYLARNLRTSLSASLLQNVMHRIYDDAQPSALPTFAIIRSESITLMQRVQHFQPFGLVGIGSCFHAYLIAPSQFLFGRSLSDPFRRQVPMLPAVLASEIDVVWLILAFIFIHFRVHLLAAIFASARDSRVRQPDHHALYCDFREPTAPTFTARYDQIPVLS